MCALQPLSEPQTLVSRPGGSQPSGAQARRPAPALAPAAALIIRSRCDAAMALLAQRLGLQVRPPPRNSRRPCARLTAQASAPHTKTAPRAASDRLPARSRCSRGARS
jgi:hypothetical protein